MVTPVARAHGPLPPALPLEILTLELLIHPSPGWPRFALSFSASDQFHYLFHGELLGDVAVPAVGRYGGE
jgi:hypothetical protein